jgi:uncharacterized protein (DUF2252 family)
LGKLTLCVDGQRRLVSDPPLIVPIDELVGEPDARRHEQQMAVLIDEYARSVEPGRRRLIGRFRYAGKARNVVGVGSVGTRAWVVMLLGRDDDDPLLMQVKEAQPSALELYLGTSEYENAGQRVVVGQRICKPTATRCSAGFTASGLTATKAITTCASCGTGKDRRTSRP